MDYKINVENASAWINKWDKSFDSLIADPSSIKTLVYLALLERQNEMSSYQDIAEELKRRGVIDGDMGEVSLRNAMFQIVKALKQDGPYEIEKSKKGKQALYKINKQNQASSSGIFTVDSNDREVVSIISRDPSASAEYIAERMIRDRRMPIYGIYLPMRAASRWVLYNEREAEDRRKYEGEQFETLLSEWLVKYRDQEISLIGLGVGEGIGEIELIGKLLGENYGFTRVHYCAIDINIHLLLDHVERLKDKFKNEIKENKLVCGAIRGNFQKDFSALIQTLRREFENKGRFNDLTSGFLPRNSGTVISILGNLIGNLEHRASEWTYFQPILEGLRGQDLAFLLGVAVQQKTKKGNVVQELYKRDVDDLLLATPKYLTHDLGILKSHQPENNTKAGEFLLPEDEAEKEKRCPSVKAAPYQGDGLVRGAHIQGSIYEFFYTTQWDLTMDLGEEILIVPAGSDLLLYNIIKFDLETLITFLESKGLVAPTYSIKEHPVGKGSERHVYAAFAITT
jgi:hypothetical protein